MHKLAGLLFPLLFGLPAAQAKPVIYPVAQELRSGYFQVRVGRQDAPVAHAATTYYFVSFAVTGKTRVSITAEQDGYWAKGVEVQPWRWGIRPVVNGRTVSFDIPGPAKLAISRPGDHGAGAEMLFVFANAPETDAPRRGDSHVRYYGPGTYHENLNPKSGETIYLAPGALVLGALNLWGVENVKVFGRGTIVYDGPQNPKDDEGWMHKPDWHVIVMDHARHIRISGIVCIVRSRTWMIQMLESRDVTFENVKVIGGCPGNANQDGMDWLGGGDTLIRDSFFRASDDIFAMYGNWLGYDTQSQTTPGETVDNILVENSVLSTSISNVVRVSWPQKIFDSHHFAIRDSDVIQMGMGGCKVPFALLEIWDDPDGKGAHEDYSFEDVRLEEWYSLLQLRQQNPAIRNVKLSNVWGLETPSLTPSVLSGDVSGVVLQNVGSEDKVAAGDKDLPLHLDGGADEPEYGAAGGQRASFQLQPSAVRPGTKVRFEAADIAGAEYEWFFGDGGGARGRVARHVFRDSKGTLLDGSGRFRVLLKVTGADGHQYWRSRPVVVTSDYRPADSSLDGALHFRYYEGANLQIPEMLKAPPVETGTLASLAAATPKRSANYGFAFDGAFDARLDGGYLFQLFGNDAAELWIDDHLVATSPIPKPQVCGMAGNMVQLGTGTMGLRAGKHKLRVAMTHSTGPDGFALRWQAPASEPE